MKDLEGVPNPETGEWREQAKSFIEDPRKWPYWPTLPLKRRHDGTVDAGGYSIHADHPTVVLRGWRRNAAPAVLDLETLDESQIIARYATVEELLDDGWTVD